MDNILKKYEIHEEREKCEKYLLPGEIENGENNLFDWDETLNSEFTLELRDKVKGLIVGIERNGQRILNPDSNLTFELNDALWIAGDRKKVKQLLT
jgi:K+/H+ antiporter YhaU regulatory subunit KhtT